MPSPSSPDDDVLSALEYLKVTLRETTRRSEAALGRAEEIERLRREGVPYSEIVPNERRPLIVELLSASLADLSDASSLLRTAEAHALYAEGLTMNQIALLFGVSRQRVSALLSCDPPVKRVRRRTSTNEH